MKTAKNIGESVNKIEKATDKEVASISFSSDGECIMHVTFFAKLGKVVVTDESK